jgi:hypothetical protein
MSKSLNVGDLCIYCFSDTSFGSGNFVNRIPADRVASEVDEDLVPGAEPDQLAGVDLSAYDTVDGYMCTHCSAYECDGCDQPVYEDAEVWDEEETGHWHPACLPKHLWHHELLEEEAV